MVWYFMEMKIFIEDLCFKAIIGILPKERVKKQIVNICVEITYTYNEKGYINYAEVTKFIKTLVKMNCYELLEEALMDIAKKIFNRFYNIHTLKLKIQKPNILKSCKVSVEGLFTLETLNELI